MNGIEVEGLIEKAAPSVAASMGFGTLQECGICRGHEDRDLLSDGIGVELLEQPAGSAHQPFVDSALGCPLCLMIVVQAQGTLLQPG